MHNITVTAEKKIKTAIKPSQVNRRMSKFDKLQQKIDLLTQKLDSLCYEKNQKIVLIDESNPQKPDAIQLNCTEDVFQHCKEMQNYTKETFRVLYLDDQNRLLGDEIVGIGSARRCFVEPQEIFRLAYKYDASKIITIHNHPSGNTRPSKADLELFERLEIMSKTLEMPLADNIIIGLDD